MKQNKKNFKKGSSTKNNRVAQKVLDFIIGANIPLTTVKHPDFIKLVEELNPAVSLPSYLTMRTAIVPHAVNYLKLFKIKYYLSLKQV